MSQPTPEQLSTAFADVIDEYLGRYLDDHCAKRLLTLFGELSQQLYVPGEWYCPKCGYFEIRTILNPLTGASGANPVPALPCPNDGEFMVRQTWRESTKALIAKVDELVEERNSVRQSERENIAFFLGTTALFTNLCVFPLALRDALGDAIRRGLHERAAR